MMMMMSRQRELDMERGHIDIATCDRVDFFFCSLHRVAKVTAATFAAATFTTLSFVYGAVLVAAALFAAANFITLSFVFRAVLVAAATFAAATFTLFVLVIFRTIIVTAATFAAATF